MIQHTPLAITLFLLSSYVIPGVSALLTPARVPQWVIGVVTPVLATAGAVITEAQADPHYQWGHAGLLLLGSLLAAVVGYKVTFEKYLTEALHKLWPGAPRSLLEQAVATGVGYLAPVAEQAVENAEKPRPKPGPGPLVTGTLAPPQTPAEPAPAEPQP